MNRYILHILLLMMLVSCSRNDDQYFDHIDQGDEMQFAISLHNVATRGADIINSHEAMDGMSVGFYAFMTNYDAPYTKELRAENVKLTYNKAINAWEYADGVEPIKWDFKYAYDRFSFYVYYPYDENATNIHFDMDNESFSIDYDAIRDQDVDVMIAQREGISYPLGGIVSIDLKHILSSITFNTDYTNPIEEVKFCSATTYKKMPKSGTAYIEDGAVRWRINDYYSDYSYSLGNTFGNYVLIIPQVVPNKGDLYFSMSYSDGKNPVDNGAQAPAGLSFEAGQTYTFKYKGSYFDYDEETNTLIINLEDYYNQKDKNDYTAIDKIIEKIKEAGATLHVAGEVESDPYNLLMHIIAEAKGIEHIDFSDLVLPPNTKLPYALFNDPVTEQTMKKIELPVMDDTNFHSAAFDNCTALEEIVFAEGSNITKLQWNFCSGCTSLKKINLEVLHSLTDVSQTSFNGCSALEEVTLPKSVATVGQDAFKNCISLKSINIPASLVSMANHAFYNCQSLYSYDHDDQKAGFILEPRPDNSFVRVNFEVFFSTYVQSKIDNKKWWTGTNSEAQIFSTPN